MNELTTVMYHYVRPIKKSRYPGIKGLELDSFIEQIKYLKKNYNLITMEDVLAALNKTTTLPPRAALLTFDDAYLDHFQYVYPVLKKHNIQGSFFAPVKAVCEGQVLDVNKIHFILSVNQDTISTLIKETEILFNKLKDEHGIDKDFEYYFNKLAVASRFDSKEVIFFKRLLQVELPEDMRIHLTNILLEKYIGIDQVAFAAELYMNKSQVAHMINDGMHFGAHGNNHYWWDKLDVNLLDVELSESRKFLLEVGMNSELLTAAYPYGGYNDLVLNQMKQHNYKLGFTTEVGVTDLSVVSPLDMPRVDTNDIEKERASFNYLESSRPQASKNA